MSHLSIVLEKLA